MPRSKWRYLSWL
jgi:hypothetical protein